jgi:hypothetical protein
MTRKDYIAIASCIQSAQQYNPWPTAAEMDAALLMKRTIAQNIAHTMANDNPRFDRAKFLAACGVQS